MPVEWKHERVKPSGLPLRQPLVMQLPSGHTGRFNCLEHEGNGAYCPDLDACMERRVRSSALEMLACEAVKAGFCTLTGFPDFVESLRLRPADLDRMPEELLAGANRENLRAARIALRYGDLNDYLLETGGITELPESHPAPYFKDTDEVEPMPMPRGVPACPDHPDNSCLGDPACWGEEDAKVQRSALVAERLAQDGHRMPPGETLIPAGSVAIAKAAMPYLPAPDTNYWDCDYSALYACVASSDVSNRLLAGMRAEMGLHPAAPVPDVPELRAALRVVGPALTGNAGHLSAVAAESLSHLRDCEIGYERALAAMAYCWVYSLARHLVMKALWADDCPDTGVVFTPGADPFIQLDSAAAEEMVSKLMEVYE